MLTDYLNLITTEHRDKPVFIETLSAIGQPLIDMMALIESMPEAFDIDSAVGVQLDALGVWIGRSRFIAVPITDVYFEWDLANVGWEAGTWQGPYDPTTGLNSLPDDAYRTLLKAKIAANRWDGTIPGAYEVFGQVFGSPVIIQDNQDMSMVIAAPNNTLDAVSIALLTGGYIPLKPAGVRVAYYATSDSSIFSWDVSGTDLQGWDAGSWATELTPS
jgi:hypothetical protein